MGNSHPRLSSSLGSSPSKPAPVGGRTYRVVTVSRPSQGGASGDTSSKSLVGAANERDSGDRRRQDTNTNTTVSTSSNSNKNKNIKCLRHNDPITSSSDANGSGSKGIIININDNANLPPLVSKNNKKETKKGEKQHHPMEFGIENIESRDEANRQQETRPKSIDVAASVNPSSIQLQPAEVVGRGADNRISSVAQPNAPISSNPETKSQHLDSEDREPGSAQPIPKESAEKSHLIDNDDNQTARNLERSGSCRSAVRDNQLDNNWIIESQECRTSGNQVATSKISSLRNQQLVESIGKNGSETSIKDPLMRQTGHFNKIPFNDSEISSHRTIKTTRNGNRIKSLRSHVVQVIKQQQSQLSKRNNKLSQDSNQPMVALPSIEVRSSSSNKQQEKSLLDKQANQKADNEHRKRKKQMSKMVPGSLLSHVSSPILRRAIGDQWAPPTSAMVTPVPSNSSPIPAAVSPNEQHHKVRAWIESQAFGEEAKRTVAREQDSPSFNLPGSASNDDWTLYHNNNDDASGPHDSTLTNEQRNKIHCSLPDSGVNQSSGKSMSSTAMQQQQSTQTTDHQTQYKRIEAAKELDRRCDETREKRNSLISHDRRFNILKRSLELNTTFDQQDSANQHTTDANEIIAKSRKCRHLVRPSSSQRAGPIELVYLEHGGVSAGSEQLQMEQQRGEHQSDGNEAANNLGGEARFCIACKGSFSENQSAGKASNHDGKACSLCQYLDSYEDMANQAGGQSIMVESNEAERDERAEPPSKQNQTSSNNESSSQFSMNKKKPNARAATSGHNLAASLAARRPVNRSLMMNDDGNHVSMRNDNDDLGIDIDHELDDNNNNQSSACKSSRLLDGSEEAIKSNRFRLSSGGGERRFMLMTLSAAERKSRLLSSRGLSLDDASKRKAGQRLLIGVPAHGASEHEPLMTSDSTHQAARGDSSTSHSSTTSGNRKLKEQASAVRRANEDQKQRQRISARIRAAAVDTGAGLTSTSVSLNGLPNFRANGLMGGLEESTGDQPTAAASCDSSAGFLASCSSQTSIHSKSMANLLKTTTTAPRPRSGTLTKDHVITASRRLSRSRNRRSRIRHLSTASLENPETQSHANTDANRGRQVARPKLKSCNNPTSNRVIYINDPETSYTIEYPIESQDGEHGFNESIANCERNKAKRNAKITKNQKNERSRGQANQQQQQQVSFSTAASSIQSEPRGRSSSLVNAHVEETGSQVSESNRKIIVTKIVGHQKPKALSKKRGRFLVQPPLTSQLPASWSSSNLSQLSCSQFKVAIDGLNRSTRPKTNNIKNNQSESGTNSTTPLIDSNITTSITAENISNRHQVVSPASSFDLEQELGSCVVMDQEQQQQIHHRPTNQLQWRSPGLELHSLSPGSPFVVPSLGDQERSFRLASKRLRELAAHLEHGSVPQSVLYQTLDYAVSVLDSVTMEEIGRVSDEEDGGDLSEVQSDSVPTEVRKWLETTFTRNSISQKCRSEDKLKFRSVANAIRAGIVVDRIYRRTSASIPIVSPEVSNLLLKSIDDWSFDCFQVNSISGGQVLKSVGYELFSRYGLMYKFKIQTQILKNFLTQIELGYVKHKNPYHNNMHAADVTQTVHYMIWKGGLTNWLSDLEIFATLLAAIIHDYLHTGTTNNFHVMSQSDTALLYNDRAVLENFHISQAFSLMKNQDCNILSGLSKDEYREFRSLVIDMVLATDMSSHFQQIKAMKNILNHTDNFNADKSKVLSLVIHISDISHPAKEWELHSQWTHLLMEEFFRQGDREKELELECSPLCDRDTTLVPESQLGFIEFIVNPSLEVCGDVLDRVSLQIAEANARPILPAAQKANSVMFSTSPSTSVGALNANNQPENNNKQPPDGSTMTTTRVSPISPVPAANEGQEPSSNNRLIHANDSTTPPTSNVILRSGSGSSSSHSLLMRQPSSPSGNPQTDTLASNLRKMIVSSSATISRKLGNIASNASANSLVNRKSFGTLDQHQQQQQTTTNQDQLSQQQEKQQQVDFEQRKAGYKHPVIRPESVDDSLSSVRSRSAAPSFMRSPTEGETSRAAVSSNQLQQLDHRPTIQQRPASGLPSSSISTQHHDNLSTKDNSLFAQGQELASTNCSLPILKQASLSAPQLVHNKIHRPWIACLERNKRMWQEKAKQEAQTREHE